MPPTPRGYIGKSYKQLDVFLGPGTYPIGSGPAFHADSRGRYAKPCHMCREIQFPIFDMETLNLNPFFDILLLSPRPGRYLNTFLTSFTSSGMKSQPEWTNIHSIHAQDVFSWGRTNFLGFLGAESVTEKHTFPGRSQETGFLGAEPIFRNPTS